MSVTATATRPDPARLLDLTDRRRPPHPGGRPCGGGCVPACATRRPAPPRVTTGTPGPDLR